jgi:CHRD domain
MKLLFQSILLAATIVAIVPTSQAQAAILSFAATLNGPNESPANASPGTGTASISIDNVLNTMRVQATFSGLTGTTTAAHIHSATAVPFTGTAGVATTTPLFTGFPTGVTSGSYNNTFDLTAASSYNAAFITANGNTTAGAEAALIASLNAGTAYFNIHTSTFAGGEIRGFLAPAAATAVPEPSATVGLLVTLGTGLILKRKLKLSKSITKEVSKIS